MQIITSDPSLKPQNKREKIPKSPSQIFLEHLVNKTLSVEAFLKLCQNDEILQNLHLCENSLDFLTTIGLNWSLQNNQIGLKSQITPWNQQIFCFVDIETTDSNPLKGNLLELGAVLCNGRGEVFGRFESLVYNSDIPPIIQDITGINPLDVTDAPPIQEVLQKFRTFLGTCVFVGHNVSFDYNFLDFLYRKHFGVGLYNQTLCSLKVAQKTLIAPRYNLQFLNDFLDIHTPISHRAYADAITCKKVFLSCSKHFPAGSTQSLLNWLKSSSKKQ